MTRYRRVVLIVFDSLGIGGAKDADQFFNGPLHDKRSDVGSNTFGHILKACANGQCDGRQYLNGSCQDGALKIPNLNQLGLSAAAFIADPTLPLGPEAQAPAARFAALREVSKGKDTPSGHYELCGLPVIEPWGYFPEEIPCFPDGFMRAWLEQSDLEGALGQCHASGTEIIARHGADHLKTLQPIIYTSADSVFQVAAHEEAFGLHRLYGICEKARRLLDAERIGRVIARPFMGDCPETFKRTGNRRDFAMPPPGETVLNQIVDGGGVVHAIGKIGDIFAMQGISRVQKAAGLPNLVSATRDAIRSDRDASLIFANFVDFDSEFGHRRDVAGYAAALEYVDARLNEITSVLRADDLLIITADHGNDPTWHGTDHTREMVPCLLTSPSLEAENLGEKASFACVAQTIAKALGL